MISSERAAARVDVALDAADQPDVGVGVDEDFHVAQVADALVDEEKNAVDDDDVGGLDSDGFARSQVGDEIVDRLFDGASVGEVLRGAR